MGNNCYKIRLAISAKNNGKSGGVRIIPYVRIEGERVYLIDVYDKSEQESISAKELKFLIELLVGDI